jgi:hypothetical protein
MSTSRNDRNRRRNRGAPVDEELHIPIADSIHTDRLLVSACEGSPRETSGIRKLAGIERMHGLEGFEGEKRGWLAHAGVPKSDR